MGLPKQLLTVADPWQAYVMKNCDPFVLGPAFAMLRRPGLSCFSWKFSSANVLHGKSSDFMVRCCTLQLVERKHDSHNG